jgi:hypothetical protein
MFIVGFFLLLIILMVAALFWFMASPRFVKP